MLASRLLRGVLAGGAGTAAMTASTTLEMRLRGRPPSLAPVEVVERLLPQLRPRSDRGRERLSTAAHATFGTALGGVPGALDAAGVREPAATLAFLAVGWSPDLVLVPVAGSAEPPWRWGAAEVAISGAHHVVYAVATSVAYAALAGASG